MALEGQTQPSSQEEEVRPGTLYLVGTPVGNLADLSARACALLRAVDVIACEDTRTSARMLNHYGISTPTLAYHEHNEREQAEQLCSRLKDGASVALISDAGTPNISDPGFRLVRACRREGLAVVPVPGPCALVLALCASGLPTHQFFFAGFLPPKTAARKRFFEAHRQADYTVVLYESRHRIAKCVDDIIEVLGGERFIGVARELTKLHETHLIGTANDVRGRLSGVQLKGEFVVVIAPEDYRL